MVVVEEVDKHMDHLVRDRHIERVAADGSEDVCGQLDSTLFRDGQACGRAQSRAQFHAGSGAEVDGVPLSEAIPPRDAACISPATVAGFNGLRRGREWRHRAMIVR